MNGELVDTAKALVRLPPAAPRTPQQQLEDRIADYKKLNEAGLTGDPPSRHFDRRISHAAGDAEARAADAFASTRCCGRRSAPSGVDPALAASGIKQNEGDEMLRIGGIKLAVDGGFEGGLMRDLYEKPWDENGTFRGLQTIDTERYIAAVRELNRQDWRVATHAVGDAAIDLVLNAYEKANAEQSIVGRRWSIEHAFIGRPRSSAAHEGARRRHLGAEPPVSRRSEPREVLGRRHAPASRRR